MYYVGQVLKDLDIYGKPIIELWDGIGYSLSEAKKELSNIRKYHVNTYSDFKILDDNLYNIAKSQGWE